MEKNTTLIVFLMLLYLLKILEKRKDSIRDPLKRVLVVIKKQLMVLYGKKFKLLYFYPILKLNPQSLFFIFKDLVIYKY